MYFCTVYGGFQVIRVELGSCDKDSAVCCSVATSCPTLCEPMDCSTLGFQSYEYLSGPFQKRWLDSDLDYVTAFIYFYFDRYAWQ